MNGDWDPDVNPNSESQILHAFIYMKNLDFFLKHEIEGRVFGKKKVTSRQGRDGNGQCDQRTLYVYTNMA